MVVCEGISCPKAEEILNVNSTTNINSDGDNGGSLVQEGSANGGNVGNGKERNPPFGNNFCGTDGGSGEFVLGGSTKTLLY